SNPPPAQALATPMRKCPVTTTNLPKFFLQRISLVTHPETQEPWFVPQDLDSKVPTAATPPPAAPEHDAAGPEPAPAAAEHKPSPPPRKRGAAVHTGPSTYILSKQSLLRELTRRESPRLGDHRRLMRQGSSRIGRAVGAAVWRSDMEAVLLELMRRRVVDGLLHFAAMVEAEDRKYLVRCARWDAVRELNHRGCLLFLGRGGGVEGKIGGGEEEPLLRPGYELPRLSTMEIEGVRYGGTLAVHDLRVLLGVQHVARLKGGSRLLRDGSLFLLGRQATVHLQMLLWKLQGYMAWDGPRDTADVASAESLADSQANSRAE
ncbi:hypothetical protein BT67DRAFT_369930, partial [Trichocladium antarcticum]